MPTLKSKPIINYDNRILFDSKREKRSIDGQKDKYQKPHGSHSNQTSRMQNEKNKREENQPQK